MKRKERFFLALYNGVVGSVNLRKQVFALKIEIIVKNEEEARMAEKYGADRLELISAMGEGGLTPSYGAINRVLKSVEIPVQVMIRPHSHGYTYSEADVNIIKDDILAAKELGANGIVFGCLTEDQTIDENMLQTILTIADGMDFTFHRAFDRVKDQQGAYRTLCQYGKSINRILTSGGKDQATEAQAELRELVKLSKELRGPTIMPGAGLTPENVDEMARKTGAEEFHYGLAFRMSHHFSLHHAHKSTNSSRELDRYY